MYLEVEFLSQRGQSGNSIPMITEQRRGKREWGENAYTGGVSTYLGGRALSKLSQGPRL